MPVPFNDLSRRHAGQREALLAEIGRFLDAGWYIGGAALTGFEAAFAAACGADHAVGVANGTDALEFALRAVGVGPGDEVVIVANAGGYAAIAAFAIGASPVYVDARPDTLQLDPAALAGALSPATRAIVVTHLYGLMNDVAAIRAELARLGRGDVAIVEDCAQAHGAARDGARAGSLGDAASFSFYPTKNLGALGDAGAVVTRDTAIAERVTALRQYGWSRKYLVAHPDGRNSRLDPLQALILARDLPGLGAANERRRAVWRAYLAALPAGWSLVGEDGPGFVAHLAVLIAPDEAARDAMRAHLGGRGIGTDIHYPVLDCDQPAWAGRGRRIGELPASRSAVSRILSLPCFPELTEVEIGEVCGALADG